MIAQHVAASNGDRSLIQHLLVFTDAFTPDWNYGSALSRLNESKRLHT